MSDAPGYPINIVAQRTGLSAHVIRMWERRYQVVQPNRTDSGRRVYSDADVERLALLRQHTARGQAISYLAHLSTEQLTGLAAPAGQAATAAEAPVASLNADAFVARAMDAVRAMDDAQLVAALADAETHLGVHGLLQRVVAPLAEHVGEEWRAGTISAAHEHFATATLRTVVGQAARPFTGSEVGPAVVVGTPLGQLHEIGALLAAGMASNLGWRVVYLGPSLPASEIAGAVMLHKARVVALSVVFPHDDPQLGTELLRLRTLLPPGTAIVVGGQAAKAYASTLNVMHAAVMTDLTQFGTWLDEFRARGA